MGNEMNSIENGTVSLGIELGSTRIKAVLIDQRNIPIAQGNFDWENKLENGIWTYHLDDVWTGVQSCYQSLCDDVKTKYHISLGDIGSIGISGMMHGYIALDKDDNLLVPFRTWRNTITEKASEELTKLFDFPVPQRWSIAHLYQAILNKESHIDKISKITTLAGYVHYKLTGEFVLGVGEASGVFPIDSQTATYNEKMITLFNDKLKEKGLKQNISDLLPKVLTAGESAGRLSETGALLLDHSKNLKAGIEMCPPEGDAGTGMVATDSVEVRTGNVSAGTSVFAMVVLEKELSRVYSEIDMVTTPSGKPVAMVHCNNCTSDLNAWADMLGEFLKETGTELKRGKILDIIFTSALDGELDCGGLLAYNYFSGEHLTGLSEGRPLFVRKPDSHFYFKNFSKTLIYSSIATLKLGMDILSKNEGVTLNKLLGHGGFFKAGESAQRAMAAATNTPVAVMETAGEGGAFGMALLASYLKNKDAGETLEDFLNKKVFTSSAVKIVAPIQEEVQGFEQFATTFKNGLEIEKTAVCNLN